MGDPLPFPVQEIYACAHDGAIHLAGGFIAVNGQITGSTDAHHVWRPDGKGWRAAAPLPAARRHPHLICWRGKLLAFGGFESPAPEAIWTMEASGWVFDVIKGNWRPAPALPAPCAEAVMLVGGTGLLHFAGGRSVTGGNTAVHEVYDPAEDRWRTATPVPQAKRRPRSGRTWRQALRLRRRVFRQWGAGSIAKPGSTI